MKKIVNGVEMDLTADEITEFNARQTAHNNNELNLLLEDIRAKRNNLIAETDIYALSDVTMSSDMTTYRQNLRDITNGVDTVEKANNITWPTKP